MRGGMVSGSASLALGEWHTATCEGERATRERNLQVAGLKLVFGDSVRVSRLAWVKHTVL